MHAAIDARPAGHEAGDDGVLGHQTPRGNVERDCNRCARGGEHRDVAAAVMALMQMWGEVRVCLRRGRAVIELPQSKSDVGRVTPTCR